MQIKQFKYSADNFGYLIWSDRTCMAVDPGAVAPMLEFTESSGLDLALVTNTHHHPDHTPGNKEILKKTGARFLDCQGFSDGQQIVLGQEPVSVILTPGHTLDSVCFAASDFLVTGDTLFNGTVGNCFSGDLDAFFYSLKKLMAFPEQTQIYAGHDYVQEAMAYARIIEKDNPDIDAFLASYSRDPVVSTLADEFKVNPYIRFNTDAVKKLLKDRGLACKTELERFKSVMEVY